MGRRTLLLITSILLAAVGTVLIALYVKSANDRAQTSVGTVNIVVVAAQIPANTGITAAEVRLEPITRQLATADTFASVSQVVGKYSVTELLPGTPVHQAMVTSGQKPPTGSAHTDIPGFGYTIDVNLPNRAAGLMNPGDLVALWAGPKTGGHAYRILKSVEVLSVGQHRKVTSASDDQVADTTVGLNVTELEILQIINAQDAGDSLSLAVIGSDPAYDSKAPTPPAAS